MPLLLCHDQGADTHVPPQRTYAAPLPVSTTQSKPAVSHFCCESMLMMSGTCQAWAAQYVTRLLIKVHAERRSLFLSFLC